MNKLFLGCLLLIAACGKSSTNNPVPPAPVKELTIKSVDASYIPEIRTYGIATKNRSGVVEGMLNTLKSEGINTIRIRLWKDPSNGHSGFSGVKAFAQEIKSLGMKVWLTVHYSDTWADPGAQTKPAAWATASYMQLKDSVYNYTKKIMQEINPDYIQIGNEINGGLLWPDGKYSNTTQMIELLKQGIKAVRDQSPTAKIMIHYAGFEFASSFYSNFTTLDYDIIALSYYPMWHGKSLDQLQSTLISLGSQFNKDIVIAETAYPFTLGWNDYTNNVIGLSSQILSEYPATEQGQKDFFIRMKNIVVNTPRGIGLSYWGAEFIAFKGNVSTNCSSWENQALWDFNNTALPAISAYKN